MEKYFQIAKLVAAHDSNCYNKKGAVIVKRGMIVSTASNKAPIGIQSCISRGFCLKRSKGFEHGNGHDACLAMHAEVNAILKAQIAEVSLKGAQIYCTHKPCFSCAKLLVHFGFSEIYYLEDYPDKLSDAIMKEAGIKIMQIN